jgi:hypothetical protein
VAALLVTLSLAATPAAHGDAASTFEAAQRGPLVITAGGTYSGYFVSSTATPTITVDTSEPVRIVDSTIVNLAGGHLIELAYSAQGNVTVDHVFGYGGNGRFLLAENFKSVTVRNCTIDKTSGIKLAVPVSGSSVLITRNKHRNIQRGNPNYGNFVQFAEVRTATVEVSWNEIINEYNQSEPEDLVSIFKSANIRVHDNYFQGQYSPNNTSTSTQNGITLENGFNPTPGLETHNNEIWNNQLVGTIGGVGMFPGTRDNYAHDNRIVQDGFLPDGVTRIGAGYRGMSIQQGTTNNRASGNVVGFVNKDGVRYDYGFDGAPGELARNTSLPNPVTKATEDNELGLWRAKLASNGVVIGA